MIINGNSTISKSKNEQNYHTVDEEGSLNFNKSDKKVIDSNYSITHEATNDNPSLRTMRVFNQCAQFAFGPNLEFVPARGRPERNKISIDVLMGY